MLASLYENLNNDQFNKEQIIQYYGSMNYVVYSKDPAPGHNFTNILVLCIFLCVGDRWEKEGGNFNKVHRTAMNCHLPRWLYCKSIMKYKVTQPVTSAVEVSSSLIRMNT